MSIKINREETNLEVLARIAKAAASQYDCSLRIDFQDGKRRIEFVGDDACKCRIADRVRRCFHPADGEQA